MTVYSVVHRPQFDILSFNFNVVHRPDYLNEDTDGLSPLRINNNLDANLPGRYNDDHSLN